LSHSSGLLDDLIYKFLGMFEVESVRWFASAKINVRGASF